MSEHIDPAELDQRFAADFADSAAAFSLLEHPTDERSLDWLASDDKTDTLSEQYEQNVQEARARFEAAMSFSLAKGKIKKVGNITEAQPYEAIDDDGTVHTVSLMQLSTSDASRPYTLFKVFTERVSIDEQTGTRTELRREFWYVSGSEYKHIPNGLERKRAYVIVRPNASREGSLTYLQDETPELTQLNRVTRLIQQSPAHQEQKQGLGELILGFMSRKKRGDV